MRVESKLTQKIKKSKYDHEKPRKNDENDKALVTKEVTLSNIGNDIFIGDSAATSHMTNNKTGVYDLTPIRGSAMIGNGESISVGSPQVSFLTCTLEIPQENCSTSSLLLTLFTFTFEPFLKL